MAETTPKIVPQVLTEIRTHGGFKLSAVGKMFPASRGAGVTNPATVWRWARVGALTPGGLRVKLEVVKAGMSWLTSQAAVDRFIMALTEASTPGDTPKIEVPNPKKAASRSARASTKLQAMGC